MSPVIVIFGADGFLGRCLSPYFMRQGRKLVCVAGHREGWSGDGMFLEWDGGSLDPWALALEGADTVINLTGRSVDCRYDAKPRKEIMDSRVESTRVIGKAIAACRVAPVCLKDGGFRWRHERVADAVADLQARRGLEKFFRPEASRIVGARVWERSASQKSV